MEELIIKPLINYYMRNLTDKILIYPNTSKKYKMFGIIIFILMVILFLVYGVLIFFKTHKEYFAFFPIMITIVCFFLIVKNEFNRVKKEQYKSLGNYKLYQINTLFKFLKNNGVKNNFEIIIKNINNNKLKYDSMSWLHSKLINGILIAISIIGSIINHVIEDKNNFIQIIIIITISGIAFYFIVYVILAIFKGTKENSIKDILDILYYLAVIK
jgi:flagellar basal body-associated protein FliL